MACERYEILLVDMHGPAKHKRDWTEAQLLGSVAWLKRMNARGHDVLIRPDPQAGLVLLDTLTHAHVAKLERNGVPYSAKVEVAPDRFQIWFKLGGGVVSARICETLAKSFGLPMPHAGMFGSLAGFVKHQVEDHNERKRFVLAHEPASSSPQIAHKWKRFLTGIDELIRRQTSEQVEDRSRGRSR